MTNSNAANLPVCNSFFRTGRVPAIPRLRWPLLITACMLAMTGCGGGGGGGDAATSGTAATNGRPQAVDSGSLVQGHFARLNEIRLAMGLRALTWNAALGDAAQRHSDYQANSRNYGHSQTPGAAGYTAGSPAERATLAGYPLTGVVTETVITTSGTSELDGRQSMDALLSAPGHRTVLLAPEFTETGIGAPPLTTLVGYKTPASVPPDLVMLYPYDGQKDVQLSYAPPSETPNPLPGVNITGMPVSVQGGRLFVNFPITNHMLRESSTGQNIALHKNEEASYARSAFVFFPVDPLKPGTTYVFTADVVIGGVSKTVRSSFTTVAK